MNANLTNPRTQVTIVTCRDLREAMKPHLIHLMKMRVINDNRRVSHGRMGLSFITFLVVVLASVL